MFFFPWKIKTRLSTSVGVFKRNRILLKSSRSKVKSLWSEEISNTAMSGEEKASVFMETPDNDIQKVAVPEAPVNASPETAAKAPVANETSSEPEAAPASPVIPAGVYGSALAQAGFAIENLGNDSVG